MPTLSLSCTGTRYCVLSFHEETPDGQDRNREALKEELSEEKTNAT